MSQTEEPSIPAEDLDAQTRRLDPERWLSSRFIADPEARADVIAIYAFDPELARAPKAYPYPTLRILRRPDSIFDYQYEDFEVLHYQHHPAIKAPVAV